MVSGVVLAGGASRRMGRDKAWVELAGRTLIERVCDRLSALCQEIIVVTNTPEPYKKLGVRLTGDVFPGKGSLGGIYSGLRAAQFDQVIAVACDMPFLNVALLRYMLALVEGYDVVVPSAPDPSKPEVKKGANPTAKDRDLHPLHAVYARGCLRPMAARLEAGDLRMISFYSDVRVRVVEQAEVDRFDPKHVSLFNVNTKEELVLAERLIAENQI